MLFGSVANERLRYRRIGSESLDLQRDALFAAQPSRPSCPPGRRLNPQAPLAGGDVRNPFLRRSRPFGGRIWTFTNNAGQGNQTGSELMRAEIASKHSATIYRLAPKHPLGEVGPGRMHSVAYRNVVENGRNHLPIIFPHQKHGLTEVHFGPQAADLSRNRYI